MRKERTLYNEIRKTGHRSFITNLSKGSCSCCTAFFLGKESSYMDNSTEEKLKAASIGKLFFFLALPAIISQFVNLLYNIVDRMFFGHIPQTGTTALTSSVSVHRFWRWFPPLRSLSAAALPLLPPFLLAKENGKKQIESLVTLFPLCF